MQSSRYGGGVVGCEIMCCAVTCCGVAGCIAALVFSWAMQRLLKLKFAIWLADLTCCMYVVLPARSRSFMLPCPHASSDRVWSPVCLSACLHVCPCPCSLTR
jgi:hypothetical protein